MGLYSSEYQNREELGKEDGLDWATDDKAPRATLTSTIFDDRENVIACFSDTKGIHCQRTPQSTSHYSHHQQSPIHPSTQTAEPPPTTRNPTVVQPTCQAYVSDLRVRPTCLTYVSGLRVRPTCQAYVSDLRQVYVATLRVQPSDHFIILIIYLR